STALHKQKQTKLIVVGSLYSGAGATFATMQLARLLNELSILHNVTELTYDIPEHYYILNGEQKCPKDYVYYNERTGISGKFAEWTSGRTVWKPLRPVADALDQTSAFQI